METQKRRKNIVLEKQRNNEASRLIKEQRGEREYEEECEGRALDND